MRTNGEGANSTNNFKITKLPEFQLAILSHKAMKSFHQVFHKSTILVQCPFLLRKTNMSLHSGIMTSHLKLSIYFNRRSEDIWINNFISSNLHKITPN